MAYIICSSFFYFQLHSTYPNFPFNALCTNKAELLLQPEIAFFQGFSVFQFCVMRSRHVAYERLSGALPNCVAFSQQFIMRYMEQNL